jgi:molybdopterin-guanine dinucleotide biosynthesis protein A
VVHKYKGWGSGDQDSLSKLVVYGGLDRGGERGMVESKHAIVLCGGASKRMGSPKALLRVGGVPLLSRVCTSLAGMVTQIVVVSAPDQELPQLPDKTTVVEDAVPHGGPLSGVSRGFEALKETGGFTFVCGCDYPFLTEGFLLGLLDKVRREDVVAVASDRPQPLCAWYRTQVLANASVLIERGEKRLSLLLKDLDLREVAVDEMQGVDVERVTFSINTPDEYRRAERMVRS